MSEREANDGFACLPRYAVRIAVAIIVVSLVLFAIGVMGLCRAAWGQELANPPIRPPRRHLEPVRQLCEGVRCLVVYEGEEHQNEPCYVTLWCASIEPCVVTQTLYAGWPDDMVWKWTFPANGMIGWEGVYPPVFRVYVGGGRLPWKIKAEGVRAWEAYETVGEDQVWPVKRPLWPTSVEVMP